MPTFLTFVEVKVHVHVIWITCILTQWLLSVGIYCGKAQAKKREEEEREKREREEREKREREERKKRERRRGSRTDTGHNMKTDQQCLQFYAIFSWQ